MTLIICFSDYGHKREYLQISRNNNLRRLNKLSEGLKDADARKVLVLNRLRLNVDGISAYYLMRELKDFTQFRLRLISHAALMSVDLLWWQIVPPEKEIIDYKWNHMLACKLWEKIETDNLMSWLSTLGGGFSALGEQFSQCAETAGKISLRQLAVGLRLGDPFLQARCKLYYSISLIQRGNLKTAKRIVRQQYKFAMSQKEYDGRLVKMCLGIWHRLEYEYGLRRERKRLLLKAGSRDNVIKCK